MSASPSLDHRLFVTSGLLLIAALLAGCAEARACYEGDFVACTCDDGRAGYAACDAEADAYGACAFCGAVPCALAGGVCEAAGAGGSGGAGGREPPGAAYAYVSARDGKIRVYSFDRETGALGWIQEVAAGQNPSFLAFAPGGTALVAADEGADELAAFAIDPASGRLAPRNRVPSNGAWPAHVAIDATGRFVLGANYGGGNVTMIALLPDGRLGREAATLPTGANAHQARIDPTNRFVLVPNVGADTVSQLVLDAAAGALVFNAVPSVALPPGSGPRHVALHPSAPYAYVIHETDDRVTALRYDPRTGLLGAAVQTVSTLPEGVSGADNTGAEIAFGAGGRFLYASNRGHDSIAVYAVDPVTGAMTRRGDHPSGGRTPRHFSVTPCGGALLVANQGSNSVVVLRVDPATGALAEIGATALPAAPTFVEVRVLGAGAAGASRALTGGRAARSTGGGGRRRAGRAAP